MADFTLSKSLFKGKHRDPSSLPGNIAYAVFVLFCFWAGAQILNLLAHAPGIYEQLMQLQMQETGRPRVEIGLASEPFWTGPFSRRKPDSWRHRGIRALAPPSS